MCYYLLREEVTVKMAAFKERTRLRLRRLRERFEAMKDRRKAAKAKENNNEGVKTPLPPSEPLTLA